MKDLNIGTLRLEGDLDRDNDMAVIIQTSDYAVSYISRCQAIKAIRHMIEVFGIEEGDL